MEQVGTQIPMTAPLETGQTEPEYVDEKAVEIDVDPDTAKARQCNMVMVYNEADGFALDCVYIDPRAEQGFLLSRLAMSPRAAKLTLGVLAESIAEYETDFGEIDL